MPGFLHIMRCVGRAVVKNGAGALASLVPFGNALFEIAKDALEDYRKGGSNSEASLRAELEAMAQAPAVEVLKVAEDVASVEAKDQSDQIRLTLVSTLSRMQDSTRHSLRRPADPSGKTVPAGLSLKTPTDLMQFLPTRPPRFKPGDRPLPGVGWELEKLLGVGGFGEVWKAHNARLTNITAALKFCLDPEAGAALLNEGANLNHVLKAGRQAGIVELKNAYLDAEPYCLEYEFIEGNDLAGAIHSYQSAKGPLTPEMATRIIRDLARPVGRVHKLSPPIVHRDLKPANVLVRTREGKSEFLITDFGIGGVAASQALEQTHQGISSTPMLTSLQGAHTPLYASPEQKRGESPDPRDDVHALGVIWYQLLVGDMSQAPPFDWIAELQSRKVDNGIIDLLGRCIAGKAERRPPNAAALTEQIEKLPGRPKALSIPVITVVSSRHPVVYGETVTFTATVKAAPPAAGTPTGKVAFMDGATILGEAPLNEGTATLTTSALSAGSHVITVSYSGDAAFSACKSPALSQTVAEESGEGTDSGQFVKPTRAEETLTVLARRGLIQDGSEIELIPEARPENAKEQDQKLFRAQIHGSSRRKSVVWLYDNNIYSLTNLTYKLEAEYGAQWADGKTMGNWRRVGQTQTLWEEASHFREQEGPSPTGVPSVAPPTPMPVPQAVTKELRQFANSLGMRFALIPAGKFLMGSPDSEEDRSDEEGPQHAVEITRPFYLGVHPATQEQYEKVVGHNPSRFSRENAGGANHPVEQVSWQEAVEFCRKLSARSEEQAAGRTYRLPTEAEWEYACRGGANSSTPFSFGDSLSSTQANFNGNHPYGGAATGPYLQRTSAVGSYQPNAFGLYDMHGNVWEWCQDWYAEDYYSQSPRQDPQGPQPGESRVIRGGGCFDDGPDCRSAVRDGSEPAYRAGHVGFRVVCIAAPRT